MQTKRRHQDPRRTADERRFLETLVLYRALYRHRGPKDRRATDGVEAAQAPAHAPTVVWYNGARGAAAT